MTGHLKALKIGDPKYEVWCGENMVMTWLVHSMNIEIIENYLLANTTQEIWELPWRAYFVQENTAAIKQNGLFELNTGGEISHVVLHFLDVIVATCRLT